jgi:nitroimidazol reductase NimA-like FMN-containing flavoprotein (pyridoxamine 5'-phosphate oxidase superfamily)
MNEMPSNEILDRFPVTNRSKVRRLPKRGSAERAQVYAILDAHFLCHIGYVIDGQPYVTPTGYWRHGDRIYWHGSSASRMLRAQTARIPVCLTVTLVDGLVLARSGFHHSINYRSVMAFGQAAKVEDLEEKKAALDAYVQRLYPGRNAELRGIDPQELKATSLLGMTIEEASAKVRTGPPVDDEPDYALPVWAGVVPLTEVVGTPIPDPRLAPGTPFPPHLAPYGEGRRLNEVLSETAKSGDDYQEPV